MPVWRSLHALFGRMSRRGDGWQEVPQFDAYSLNEDDELMRMAAEADDFLPSDPDSTDQQDHHTDDNPVFSAQNNFLQWRLPQRQTGMRRLCRITCDCGMPRSGEKPSPWLLTLSVLMLLGVCGLSAGLGVYSVLIKKPEPVIDKSIQAFSIPNHRAYINLDALMLARKNNASHFRVKRDIRNSLSSESRSAVGDSRHSADGNPSVRIKRSGNFEVQKYPFQIIKRWKMQVIYLAVGNEDHNIFTEERLNMVHKIESNIIAHPRFQEFCLRDLQVANFDPAVRDQNACAPLNSLLSYFFPSQDSNGNIFYDGFGKNLDNVKSALNLAMNHDSFYYFVDEKINKTYQKSRLLRTEVLFGAPLPGFLSLGDHREEQTDRFKEFVVTYIDLLSKASTDKVHVLYGGNELFDYEVESTFWADVRMAVYACIGIALFMFLLTSFSIYLTFMGIFCIVLSFPLAFFFYRVVFNILALGILNGAAAFVIIGIGVDDVFVFINIFRQTTHMKSVNQRLLYTVKTAGVATFFTSFTTSVAFAANIASSIPAVYEFGLFMSLVVGCCWLTVFLLLPPVLYIYAFWFEPLEHMCGSLCCHCMQKPEGNIPLDAQEVANSAAINSHLSDDDDVPLIQMENDVPAAGDDNGDGDDDVPILIPPANDISPPNLEAIESASSSSIGRVQQYVLGLFVDKIVIRFRIPFIVLFVLLMGASIGCMTQLRPSDHPPQLFMPDTNLQRLLDLKANFSIIDTLHCDRCSALYNVKAEDSSTIPSPPPPLTTHQPPSQPKLPTTLQPQPQTPQPPPQNTTPRPGAQPPNPTDRGVPPAPATTTTTTTTTTSPRRHLWTPAPPTEKIQNLTPRPNIPADQPAQSVDAGYNVCKRQNCEHLKDRPIMQSGATVYVVFGIKGVTREGMEAGHVLNEFKGDVIFDEQFADEVGDLRNLSANKEHIRELCTVCNLLASNTELVQNGSAQCLPNDMPQLLNGYLQSIQECQNLPKSLTIYHHEAPAHAEASISQEGKLIWLAFAFESTTSKGQSYFEAYKNYLKWEKFLQHIRDTKLSANSPLRSMFQASEFWTKVLMEVVAVNSAIYSLVLSLVVCVCAVAIFTGHFVLLLIIFITIVAMICLVVAVFYMAGWQMGAVEAVSLSILVGSSVDYCMHLVEGYLLVGKQMPDSSLLSSSQARCWRTTSAVRHIGASIISSALTTIIAAVPLTQTTIQPFAKFGAIVLINSSVSIIFTLTLCVALLTTFAPARFVSTWRSHALAFTITAVVCGVVLLALYICSVTGVFIPGPNGDPLFG